MHDIYDPPPVPEIDWKRPKPEPLIFSKGDVLCLVSLCGLLLTVSGVFWRSEPWLALVAAGAGALVVLESWFTALAYLHRCPPLGLRARWTIFLAALLPWVLGVSAAVAFLCGIFWISDHLV
jgi:hypothetical protein